MDSEMEALMSDDKKEEPIIQKTSEPEKKPEIIQSVVVEPPQISNKSEENKSAPQAPVPENKQ